MKDNRRFPRLASGVCVRCRSLEVSNETREYLTGIVENYSIGGVFIATHTPFAEGSVLELDFSIHDESPVSARAVVRWRQRLRKPAGVGLEFIEFTGIGKRDFESLISRIFK